MTDWKAGLAAALVTVVMSAAPSSALTYVGQEPAADGAARTVLVDGKFDSDDDLRLFENAVRHHRASAVTFESGGGDVRKAMELGRLIRRLGLDTVMTEDGECASACSLAFMGGVTRTAAPGTIGMHQSRTVIPDLTPEVAMARTQRLVADKIAYLNEMEVDPGVLEIAFRTAVEDMHYLTAAELHRYRVLTPGNGDAALEAADKDRPAAGLPHDRPFWAFIQQQALLYEETPEDEGRSSTVPAGEGRVFWSLAREVPGEGLPPEPVIRADIEFADAGLSARLTLRRNATGTLDASHLLDLLFATADGFTGEHIAAVRTPALKHTEAEAGEALHAAPQRITDRYYLVTLDAADASAAANRTLLRERAWIDLPVTYANGRRALMTLEKGPVGTEVFAQALQAWREAADAGEATQ